MKKLFIVLLLASFFIACNNEAENKTDNQKVGSSEAAEAADTSNAIDKAQEKANEIVDTLQSKGSKIGDTRQKKVIEPVKKDVKKAGDKLKEKVNEIEEKIKQ